MGGFASGHIKYIELYKNNGMIKPNLRKDVKSEERKPSIGMLIFVFEHGGYKELTTLSLNYFLKL